MSVKAYSLTTASRLSSYMEITTPTGTKLATMEAMIDGVTEFIEDYLGFRVQKTTYTQEAYDTEQGQTLVLNHAPVVNGETFTLSRRTNSLNEDEWDNVDSSYYFVDEDAGIIYGASGWEFARTRRGYRVTYTAGYDFDNSATFLTDTKGGGIELAAWILLEALWNRRKGGSGVLQERIGDYSITYSKIILENEDVKALLDKYAKIEPVGVLTPLQI